MSHEPLTVREASASMQVFVRDVGVDDEVCVSGSKSHWDVGRDVGRRPGVTDAVREVHAPSGVIEVQASELIVRVGAGTPVAELDVALAEVGLQCPLDPSDSARTVGGVLAVGRSGVRRLRHGHVRDLVLEMLYVSADGVLRRAGAPVVKNVTGYDLARVFVGSLGTLALVGEVVLRCGPLPQVRIWLRAEGVDPWLVRRSLFRPSSIVWDGTCTYVQLEGPAAEVAVERRALPGSGWAECEAPLLGKEWAAVEPSLLRQLQTESASTVFATAVPVGWLAEVGVGVIHGLSLPTVTLAAPVLDLNRKLKDAFDPTGRLNPGVLPW
jgi:FAD binding domain